MLGGADAELPKPWKHPRLEENGRKEEREGAQERVLCKTSQRFFLRPLCQAL